MADARDLKSLGAQAPCGFESRHRHDAVCAKRHFSSPFSRGGYGFLPVPTIGSSPSRYFRFGLKCSMRSRPEAAEIRSTLSSPSNSIRKSLLRRKTFAFLFGPARPCVWVQLTVPAALIK